MEKNFLENEAFKELCLKLKDQLADVDPGELKLKGSGRSYAAVQLAESLKVLRSAILTPNKKVALDDKKKAVAAILKNLTEVSELQRGAYTTEKWRESQKQLFLLFRNSLMYETISTNKLKKSWVGEYLMLSKLMKSVAPEYKLPSKDHKIVAAKENIVEEELANSYPNNSTETPKPFGNLSR